MHMVKTGKTDGWESASPLPRGKDELGNETLLFGETPIRADFRGGLPMLALPDVLGVCGLHPKSNRGKLDLGGSTAYYPFETAGGRQRIKTVDLDDAYRIAMQGRSPECRKFRDFLVEILRRIERGETIDPKPPHAAAGDPDASPLVHQAALLLKIALKSAEHDRQLAVLRADADRVEARRFEADRAMRTLPSAAIPVPAMSKIDLTERLVRLWCNVNGCDFQL
ncbi:hypothetical protein, partial [Paludisphaera soli]|uniref:hypothetical protein n=1 Tax=Paludisphaera soli TaxID=2712865 RepID=UPI001981ABF2